MQHDLDTIEGCRAFLRRIREEAQARGLITMTPREFVRAVELEAIKYLPKHPGVSVGGTYVGEFAATVDGAHIALNGGARVDPL